VLCLRELPLFGGLDARSFANVCLRASKLRAAKGQCLFHQGEPADAVYLVKAGKLKLVQATIDGRAVILDIVGPGEVLGETALFQAQTHAFSAIALEDVGLCAFSRQQFEAMVRQSPEVATRIIAYLARRLHDAVQQAGEASGVSVRERLLRLLLRLADRYGEKTPDATVIELQITQQELADMVGASRVMVANVLGQLQAEGIVQRSDGHYQLRRQPCLLKHFS
jgi:CRP/FNR family transcriptional regulator